MCFLTVTFSQIFMKASEKYLYRRSIKLKLQTKGPDPSYIPLKFGNDFWQCYLFKTCFDFLAK